MVLNYRKLLKPGCALLLISGGGWMCYQVYKTKDALNHIVNTDVLDARRSKVQYIYLTDPLFAGRSLEDEKLPVPQWWNSLQNSLAWRLLMMAKKGDLKDRLHAVRSLAEVKDLNDSDYRQLAQVCDARTAVGLARTENVDHRFFLKAPYAYVSYTRQELVNELHHLIQVLNLETDHPCLQYFLSKEFPEFQDQHKLFDQDHTSVETPHSLIKRQDLLPVCLKTLVHHSSLKNNGKDIVKHGGLGLLMSVYRHCISEYDIQVLLVNLIANISVNQDFLETMFQTGWIGVLAEWIQHPDIKIFTPAAKALANLDSDDNLHNLYPNGVYPLHPLWRTTQPIKMDVVFVHGLLGGVLVTWRQRDSPKGDENKRKPQQKSVSDQLKMSDEKTQEYIVEMNTLKQEEWEEIGQDFETVMTDFPENTNVAATGPFSLPSKGKSTSEQSPKYTQCWPMDWLPKDCNYLRVLGVNYDTKLTLWSPMCPAEKAKSSLSERSEELFKKLHMAGIGCRPVIWVAHSMGGLLVKNTLVKAWKSEDPRLQKICLNTKGIGFYSVPHQGTPMANLTSPTEMLVSPTMEVQELRENSPALKDLHKQFLAMLHDIPIEVISFAETKTTLVPALRMQFNFVPLSSSDPGIGEFFEIPQDHLCICKPASRESFLYQKIVHLINKILATIDDSSSLEQKKPKKFLNIW